MDEIKFSIKEQVNKIRIYGMRLEFIGEIIDKKKKVFVISDSNVLKLYRDRIEKVLAGVDYYIEEITPGEDSKSMEELMRILAKMQEFEVTRKDKVIAFGGGVVGDLSGFASSIYLRGVEIIQIPTTVLSQVDSSVGGKTAVNFNGYKNRIGTFYQPKEIIIDPETLDTLDEREFNNGIGEIIKYACILDEKLARLCGEKNFWNEKKERPEVIEEIIEVCIKHKINIVQQDEHDKGIRNILNFGHTIGHSIEHDDKYNNLKHGEAVSVGMYLITRWSEYKGYTEKGTAEEIRRMLYMNNLPFYTKRMIPEEVLQKMKKDKKFSSDKINLVLLKKNGESYLKECQVSEVNEMINYVAKINDEMRNTYESNEN